MTICQAIDISVSTGPLFRTSCGQSILIDAFSTVAAEARLKTYLTAAGLSNKSLYSFRCGGAITMALTGSTLDDIVDHLGWRSHNMAKYYLQLHKSLWQQRCPSLLRKSQHNTKSSISLKYLGPLFRTTRWLIWHQNSSPLRNVD